jgi:hypothetical protein
LARDLERLWVERDDGVQHRAAAVVCLDPRQMHLHQLLGGQRAGIEGGVEVGNRRLVQIDRLGRWGDLRCHEQHRDEHQSSGLP